MSILITGGAGFIGSNLVSDIVEEHDVTVLDNLHTGNIDNPEDVKSEIDLIEDSCGNIRSRMSDHGFDTIVHLGISSSSPMYKEDPLKNYAGHTLADITRARDVLGYTPEYSLERGVKELIG